MKKKILAKTSWYKSKPGDTKEKSSSSKRENIPRLIQEEKKNEKPTTAVMFVPRTPGGELALRLREAESEMQKFCKSKVRIVEETGDTAKALVHKANQWAGEDCRRSDCLICRSGDNQGDCRRRNLVYQTSCSECSDKGRDTLYVGESSRSGYERRGWSISEMPKHREKTRTCLSTSKRSTPR